MTHRTRIRRSTSSHFETPSRSLLPIDTRDPSLDLGVTVGRFGNRASLCQVVDGDDLFNGHVTAEAAFPDLADPVGASRAAGPCMPAIRSATAPIGSSTSRGACSIPRRA